MALERFTYTGARDGELAAYKWLLPDGRAPRAAIQIAHGMAEHALRYAPVAEMFNKAGYAVYAHDHRGHGKTAKDAAELGFFGPAHGWRIVVEDLYRMNQLIAQAHPGTPKILIGHSMGSYMAQTFMIDHSQAVDGVILSATNDSPGVLGRVGLGVAQVEAIRLGKRGRSPLLKKFSFDEFNKAYEPARTPFDWLSRDERQVDLYVKDPLCGFEVTCQLWIDLLTGMFYNEQRINRARVRSDLPIYMLSGGGDPTNRLGEGAKALAKDYASVGARDVSLKVYASARHEIFNEINREEVFEDMLNWLDKRLPKRAAASRRKAAG